MEDFSNDGVSESEGEAPEAEMEEASAIMTPAQMVIIVIVAGFVFMLVIGYLRVELTNASTGPTRRSRCLPKIRMFLLTAAFGGAAALCIMMWLVQGASTNPLIVLGALTAALYGAAALPHLAIGLFCPSKNCWPALLEATVNEAYKKKRLEELEELGVSDATCKEPEDSSVSRAPTATPPLPHLPPLPPQSEPLQDAGDVGTGNRSFKNGYRSDAETFKDDDDEESIKSGGVMGNSTMGPMGEGERKSKRRSLEDALANTGSSFTLPTMLAAAKAQEENQSRKFERERIPHSRF